MSKLHIVGGFSRVVLRLGDKAPHQKYQLGYITNAAMFRKLIILGTLHITILTSLIFVVQFYSSHSRQFYGWNRIKLFCLICEHIFSVVALCFAYRYEEVEQFIEWLRKSALVVLVMSAVAELLVMLIYRKSPFKKYVPETGLDPMDRVFLSVWLDLYNQIFAYALTGIMLFCIFKTGERIQTESHINRRNTYIEQGLRILRFNPADNPENKSCPICLCDYQVQEQIAKTSCNHMFHNRCMLNWLETSNTCPICRQELF